MRLNLLVSLAAVSASAVARFGFATFSDIFELLPKISSVMAGIVVAAWFGTSLLACLGVPALTRLIAALLAVVAVVLLADSALTIRGGAAGAGAARRPQRAGHR